MAIATGDIQFNKSVFTKIGDIIRRTLQNLGVKVKFNEGRDVSFHYFYCEIEYFQQIINRINCEEDYKNYLQNNGYGTDFINVEKIVSIYLKD